MIGHLGASSIAATTVEQARLQLIIGLVAWAVFGTAGAVLAMRRGSSIVLGTALGLLCGFVGLFFITRLPTSDGRKLSRKLASADDDLGGVRVIDPEIARKYGLPPQRDPAAPAGVAPVGVVPVGVVPVGEPAPSATPYQAPTPVTPPYTPAPDASVPPAPMPSWSPGGGQPADAAVTPWGAVPAAPVAPPVSGWWAPDPTGRFAERWWDGTVWTHRVLAADGTEHVDTGG